MIKIRNLRKKMNLSQKELAQRLHVTQGAISQWELGILNPRADKLPQLAKILKCSIDELLTDRKVV